MSELGQGESEAVSGAVGNVGLQTADDRAVLLPPLLLGAKSRTLPSISLLNTQELPLLLLR